MTTPGKRLIPRERLDLAEALFLAGKSRQLITRAICDRFGVTTRCARKYIALVEAKIAALPKPPPEATFHRVESMLLETYALARDGVRRIVVSQGAGAPSQVESFPEANVGAMATVATRLADLYGVGAPQKVDVTSNGQTVGTVDPTDPRWTELQREHLGAARQGVSDEARPDGDADPLAAK